MIDHQVGFAPPMPSTAHRKVALSSKGHFCGQIVIGGGGGEGTVAGVAPRHMQVESFLEFSWCMCLSRRADISDLREQVAFDWFDDDVVRHTHYFDLFATLRDGRRIAFAVRPISKTAGKFARQMPLIAAQARERRFADEVRLLTDADLDPVEFHNARLLHDVRAPDPVADAAVLRVLGEMSGTVSLANLTARAAMGAAGFRALLRLVGRGHLRPVRVERITRNTAVYKWSNA